jgi:hypothetical protein
MRPLTTTYSNTPPIDDSAITAAIMTLLMHHDHVSSFCPSVIARALVEGKDWRALMPQIRRVLQDLMHRRRVVLTRGTDILTAEDLEGRPIRFRRGARFGS